MNLDEWRKTAFGAIYSGHKQATLFDPSMFGQYEHAVQNLKDGKDKSTLLNCLNQSDIVEAAEYFKKLQELPDWHEIDLVKSLSEANYNYNMGRALERASKKLQENQQVDILPIYGQLTSLVSGDKTGLVDSATIDYKNYTPFMKSGYKPWDDIIGGMPTDGPIVFIAPEGTGKSHFGFHFMSCFLTEHEQKTGAIYTLEMSAKHYVNRELGMYPQHKKIVESHRLHISGSVRNIEELVGEVSAKKVDFVVIDAMNDLVNEESPAEFEKAYKRVKEICRFLEIPVMVIAQPNRTAKMTKTFLSKYSAMWSSAAENSAALLVMGQMVDPTDSEWTDETYPLPQNDPYPRLYQIFYKSRDGWPVQQGPGAIRIEPNKKDGEYKQLWIGEVYRDTLFRPNYAGKRKINGMDKGRE